MPSPTLVALVSTSAAGAAQVTGTWPASSPAGLEIYLQAWVPDPGAILGVAASNAVQAVGP